METFLAFVLLIGAIVFFAWLGRRKDGPAPLDLAKEKEAATEAWNNIKPFLR